MSTIKLKPDKTLLCPTFDGYKLTSASGQFTSYTKPVNDGLCVSSSRSDNSSYLYTKLDALHNCLTPETTLNGDSSYSTVYCFNKRGQLLAYDFSSQNNLCPSRAVWQAELAEDAAERPSLLLPSSSTEEDALASATDEAALFGWLRPTLVLASPSLAVTADGRRHLTILQTGDRSPEAHHTWTTVFTANVGSCEVADARLVPNALSNSALLHVLLVAVVPPALLPVTAPSQLSRAPSLHLVTWLTISIENGEAYKVVRERLFAGAAALEYCQLDTACSAVVLLTHQHYTELRDSARPEVGRTKETPANKMDDQSKERPLFIYQQTDDDVTVRVITDSSASSESLRIGVTNSELCVGLRKGEDLLKGTFFHAVDPDTATWTVEGGRVEINVCKTVTGQRWEKLLREPELTGEEQEEFQETDRLAHLTSETWGGCSGVDEKPAYQPGELDSCDDADSDLLLLVLEGEGRTSVESTPRAHLGNTQYLATISSECGEPSLFCIRHDVDGVAWRVGQQVPEGSGDRFTHTATFNAFGYVRAGKTMAKYTSAPTDCSYVAVCDVRSHVYLFCQPQPLGGELKNRRTGKVTSNVARQLLLSLPEHHEVMGFATFQHVVFVCTSSDVYAYALSLGNA